MEHEREPIREKKHRLDASAYTGICTVSFTLCIEQRKRPFEDASIVGVFRSKLDDSLKKHQCDAPICCFMPDHLHILARGTSDTSLVKTAIDRFKWATGKWFAYNGRQFRWQDDYYDHVIRSDEDWRTHLMYILGNPCRAGLAEDALAYPFSGSIGFDLREILRELY